ncbi:MAG: hypothetical protein HQ517_16775 [SAR324 cluster bacterium]|nr:hypothetical protein [SAR324 cluster bacterium]
MKVSEFEENVWRVEGIRIVLRANPDSLVEDYDYKNAADERWRVTELIEKRITTRINGIFTMVLQGNGEEPHGGILLKNIRKGYAD